MIKFSHISQLHNVVRSVERRRSAGEAIEKVRFRGTVKLHGSNASVVCSPAGLQPQSRNRELSLDDDNLGFARFVAQPEVGAAIRELESALRPEIDLGEDRPLVLYGEWIGPGVQKGVGVAQLPVKQWVLFALATRDEGEESKRWFELPAFAERFGDRFTARGIHSIRDVASREIELDFGSRIALSGAAEQIDEWTRAVDERCPWAARFGVEGVGEGLVWVPLGRHFGDSELFFKSKGERHQIVRRKKKTAAAVDPEELSSIQAFVAYSVTDARLAQGLEVLRERGLELEMRSMGPYLEWIGRDIKRECADELEANGLEWKRVAKAINAKARSHFRNQFRL
ncbi:hypothetical protein PPSIR1_21884 [Plesiocystis pacifica SIR-1]|uniref:RNA ligase domain-containing protein n=1 Tax=Plesiocystis pacifica SIR-1 TaxID=391625 RepID=A6FXM4_9BACT|nr:RNA ligase family protein [Plesiocystis pacifica]EDM81612.1 hypothetical protein PPSIR1_21884 [Plesiocystis pacifica SIR-1]